MHKRLYLRIAASLILSAMLLVLPIGALVMNKDSGMQVYAEEGTEIDAESDIETGIEETGNGDSTDETEGDVSGNEGEEEPTPTPEPAPEEPEPECICDSKCSQYEYNHNCPVCSADYSECAYKEPSVRITINVPDGWYKDSCKVTFKVEDIANTGNLAVKSVMAKIGANGSYMDVTEEMYLEVAENCTVYVLVTDVNDKSYERSRNIRCFDTGKPTLNAAVSDGLLTVQAVDTASGVSVIYINGYEFTNITNGTLNVRLSQFDAGYEYFTITAMDAVGNMSEVYKTKNPYYKDPESEDDDNPAEQLPVNVNPTNPSSATATVTDHTRTDADGNAVNPNAASGSGSTTLTPEEQKKREFAQADAEEAAINAEQEGEDQNLGKEFYTIEAASGKVFYLIIDRDGEEEIVYFLTEITENDLLNVTSDNSETLPKNSAALESQLPITESALPNNNDTVSDYNADTAEVATPTEVPAEESAGTASENESETGEAEGPAEPKNPLGGYIFMGIIGAMVIGAAYYFKVVKKKDDDFEEEEDGNKDEGAEYDNEEPQPEFDTPQEDPNEAFFNQDFDTDDVTETVDDSTEE